MRDAAAGRRCRQRRGRLLSGVDVRRAEAVDTAVRDAHTEDEQPVYDAYGTWLSCMK